ncbi:hypothetical protein [Paraburkholderia sp. C35]|uniref:hypothetical protein n=1 Tax=Paraburkholderia sp. C35 TaxID=2126993 RepID=UPI0013A5ABB7|nr:hypothetical protein [Paraburkholderia sp. C35]
MSPIASQKLQLAQLEQESCLFSAVGDADLPWIVELVERLGVDMTTPRFRSRQLPVFALMRLGMHVEHGSRRHAVALVWQYDHGLFEQNYAMSSSTGLASCIRKARAVIESTELRDIVQGMVAGSTASAR